jgi:hypothetical protein
MLVPVHNGIRPYLRRQAERQIGLVFLAFFQGAVGGVEVGARREALHGLGREIAVGHRVAQHRRTPAGGNEAACEVARGLRLAAAGTHGTHRDDRPGRFKHRAPRPGEDEIAALRGGPAGGVQYGCVENIAVGKHHRARAVLATDRCEIRLIRDRDAVRIVRPGQFARIAAPGDAGDLRGRERDDAGSRAM